MYRYVNINLGSKEKSSNINKKLQKTTPISLISGGDSFFVKVKSNQIASSYNDRGNKLKQKIPDKITKTYLIKDDKNDTYNKYLNNSQNKNSLIFTVNNSLEYKKPKNNVNKNNKKPLNNKTKLEIYTHNKKIYSFPSIKNIEKLNNKSINSSSLRQNYNEVLLTDVELAKKNLNKNAKNQKKINKITKITKDINEKYNNNTFNSRINKTKTLNNENKLNINKTVFETLNKNSIRNTADKNLILTGGSKNNNQIKFFKKKQNVIKDNFNNNKNVIKYKNISHNLTNNINNNRNRDKIINKNNISEEKNRVITHIQKNNNKILIYNEQNRTIVNNTSIIKDNFNKAEEFNSSISKRRNQKTIKSINIKPNKESLRIQNNINNNPKYNFNNNIINIKPSLNQKNIIDNNRHIISKSNLTNKSTILNNFISNDLIGTIQKNNKDKGNKSKLENNIDLMEKEIEKNQKAYKYRNKYILSDLTPLYSDNNKINNYPNIIINNNYLYNYYPIVTLNEDDEKINQINRDTLNRNSFIESNLFHHNINMNYSQNFLTENIFNLSSITDNKINKEQKNKIDKKFNEQQLKLNIKENNNQNKLNINTNKYNFHTKFISSNNLDNNIIQTKQNKNNFNQNIFKQNSNNIIKCYISKEKNKRQKQNPPLNKNPKKLNILSLIQENSKKTKDIYKHQPQFITTFNNKDKNYKNKIKYDETIDDILNPKNYKINDSMDMFDNFDDINSILRRINFENIDLKTPNIFTVNDESSGKNNNVWYTKYKENFNNMFDKKFTNNKQNMSATQNKIKKNNYVYHSRQSGSTKENSSNKKIRISSYIDKKIEKKNLLNA